MMSTTCESILGIFDCESCSQECLYRSCDQCKASDFNKDKTIAIWYVLDVLKSSVSVSFQMGEPSGQTDTIIIDDTKRTVYIVHTRLDKGVLEDSYLSGLLARWADYEKWINHQFSVSAESACHIKRYNDAIDDKKYSLSFQLVTTARLSPNASYILSKYRPQIINARGFWQSPKELNRFVVLTDYRKLFEDADDYANIQNDDTGELTGVALVSIAYYALLSLALFVSVLVYADHAQSNTAVQDISLLALALFNVASWSSLFASFLKGLGLSKTYQENRWPNTLRAGGRWVIIIGHIAVLLIYFTLMVLTDEGDPLHPEYRHLWIPLTFLMQMMRAEAGLMMCMGWSSRSRRAFGFVIYAMAKTVFFLSCPTG